MVVKSLLLGLTLLCLFVANGEGQSSEAKTNSFTQPETLAELLALPPDQLDQVDVAVMNLLCAEGLRGSEKLDVPQLIRTLDAWARWVGIVTKQNYHRFVENPQYFHNDTNDYRMAFLAATLQRNFGVRYNPERAEPQLKGGGLAEPEEVFFANSKDVFIHGLLVDNHYGTCASMPVLFVAVAQRLGYPVKLAGSKGHLYVRYDEGDRHFNVEATSPGYSIYPDEHYKNWPVHISDEEIREHHFLQPLDGKEMLADFLSTRAVCLRAAGQLQKAEETMAIACKLAPQVKWFKMLFDAYGAEIADTQNKVRWERLQTDIAKIEPPEGDSFDYFRDKKISLHFYLTQTGDLDAAEKALASLTSELATNSPTRSALHSDELPQPHPIIQIIVMPEKVTYTTMDGQPIELLVKSPQQLESFLREQRLFDKVWVIDNTIRQFKGLPADAPRPTSFNVPPGISRETALKAEEERLDEIISEQQKGQALAQLAGANAIGQSALPPQMQATVDLINSMNALNGGGSRNPFLGFSPQMGMGNGPGLPGIPKDVQNILSLGKGGAGIPGFPPGVLGQPTMPVLPKEVQNALDLRRQLEVLSQLRPTNSVQNEKAQK